MRCLPPTLARVWFLGVLLGMAGCGGQLGGSDEEGAPTGDGGGAASGGDAAEEDELGPGDLVLGECELGFLPTEAEEPCNWLAEHRCYETKSMACSCVCPRGEESLCLSDFYGGEGSRTKVTCR